MPSQTKITTSLTDVIKKLLFLFLLFSGLYFAKEFLMPICIAGILATLFLPFCNWMEHKKIHKAIAVCVCLLTLLLTLFTLISLLGYKIAELLSDIAIIKQKAIGMAVEIQNYILNHLNISIQEQNTILKSEQPSYGTIMQSMLGSITGFLTNIILVLVYFLFLLFYRQHIKNFIIQLTSDSNKAEMEHIVYSASRVSQNYLIGLSKMIVILWIMYGIGFSIIGVENAIFFAILCGLMEIVPYVGNITGTILTIVVAAIHGANPTLLFGIVITYGVVQLIQGWVLEPLILGPQLKINPLFTILALVLGELLWGIPGIILAIPITAVLKIICDHIEPLKPYGFLIGEIVEPKKESVIVKRIREKIVKKISKNGV
jgi:predicted PurR-regulated permease PerM